MGRSDMSRLEPGRDECDPSTSMRIPTVLDGQQDTYLRDDTSSGDTAHSTFWIRRSDKGMGNDDAWLACDHQHPR